MRVASQERWIRGFPIGDKRGNSIKISHLLYADDTIILCDPKAEQVAFIRLVLVLFEAVAGLKVKWSKSSLIPLKEVPQMQGLSSISGCRIEELPKTY